MVLAQNDGFARGQRYRDDSGSFGPEAIQKSAIQASPLYCRALHAYALHVHAIEVRTGLSGRNGGNAGSGSQGGGGGGYNSELVHDRFLGSHPRPLARDCSRACLNPV